MKKGMREFPVTMDEIRDMMKKEEAKRYSVIIAAVGVVAILAGLIIWIGKRREKDLEDHYEYFDDDFDELDDHYKHFDDSIYDDEDDDDEQIEYVKIRDFINEDEDEEKSSDEEKSEEAPEHQE